MRPLRGLLVLGAALLLGGTSLIDVGELHCQEAVNHLDDCCQAPIDRQYSCTAGRGCDDTRPDLDDPLATQVRDESCADLVASGACENPPKSPLPPCGTEGQPACYDAATPVDFSVEDLASPDLESADLYPVDGEAGDGR